VRFVCFVVQLGLAAAPATSPNGNPADSANAIRPWTEYRTILWVGDTVWQKPDRVPLFLERLREMGINTAMVHGDADPRPFVENGFPYYVENLVNQGLCLKWNSNVRDWDRFITDWARNGRPESAFVRDYCLEDPDWRSRARGQVERIARRNQPHAPLAYNLRDELSTTFSANPFDYDFSPRSLAKLREWLKEQYRPGVRRPLTPALSPSDGARVARSPGIAEGNQSSDGAPSSLSPSDGERVADRPGEGKRGSDEAALAELNAEWDTTFAKWEDVRPFSTDQIKHRMTTGEAQPRGQPDWQAVQQIKFDPATARRQPTHWNFAPWCDFRSFMDQSLAGCLDELRRAAQAVDPHTPVGIEGTQMPHAFGGYDLWRLSQALDWVEPYDVGNAREIFGSFMPGKPILTTVFETETRVARRRLWHLLLEGDRGCIVWWSEDCIDWKSPDYALTPKARALAPVLREMTSPLARLFLRAKRERSPVYLHYSQPSIQVDWLLESTVDGSTWPRRFSGFEAEHNRQAKARNAWLKALQDLGHRPRFISSKQLEELRLDPSDHFTLVLPRSYAMSDREIASIQTMFRGLFTTSGPERLVLADGTPGTFDEHGRLRIDNPLERYFPATNQATVYAWSGLDRPARALKTDTAELPRRRLRPEPPERFWKWLGAHPVTSYVKLPPSARARIHRFSVGEATLIAIERNVDYQMSEDLKQAGGNEALEKPAELTARLGLYAFPVHIYDLRTERKVGQGMSWSFTLDPWEPSLFALVREPVPEERLLSSLLDRADQTPAAEP
jgi:hypothetical protein